MIKSIVFKITEVSTPYYTFFLLLYSILTEFLTVLFFFIVYFLSFRSAQALLMGASSAAQAFAFAPNFQKGIKAAGRVILLLNRQSKITDPAVPINNFVSLM